MLDILYIMIYISINNINKGGFKKEDRPMRDRPAILVQFDETMTPMEVFLMGQTDKETEILQAVADRMIEAVTAEGEI